MNFEALLALTNFAVIDDEHRNKIVSIKEMIPSIESLALEEHEMIRRAAVQLMCNLTICEKYRKMFEPEVPGERFKLLILMCQEDDDETRSAAAGALATLTNYNPEFCKQFSKTAESWQTSVNIIAFDQSGSIRHRALVLIQNISDHDIETADILSKTDLKEILIGMSKNLEVAWSEELLGNNEMRELLGKKSKTILETWVEHKLIVAN